jgi:hypothetical protein
MAILPKWTPEMNRLTQKAINDWASSEYSFILSLTAGASGDGTEADIAWNTTTEEEGPFTRTANAIDIATSGQYFVTEAHTPTTSTPIKVSMVGTSSANFNFNTHELDAVQYFADHGIEYKNPRGTDPVAMGTVVNPMIPGSFNGRLKKTIMPIQSNQHSLSTRWAEALRKLTVMPDGSIGEMFQNNHMGIQVQDGIELIRVDGVEVTTSVFEAITGETWKAFYLNAMAKPDETPVEFPRKVEDVKEIAHLMPLAIYYDDTGEEVKNVFAYDLDAGYCWQHVFDADGFPQMEGKNIAVRRVNGDFTIKRPERRKDD